MNLCANREMNLVFIRHKNISDLIFLRHCRNLSSADETVHIFNCTKIPLKFALNKLSRNKRNFKSHLPRSLRRHDIATVFIHFFFIVGERVWRNIYETAENFHFKRFLSYFHFEKNTELPVGCADASINLNNQ